MIITRTPFRVSLFGGSTDFPSYFNENGGTVISSAIDKYCYVTVHNLPHIFKYKTIISYSVQERVNSYDEIKNPVVRESMRLFDMHNLKINYDSDLPARSGLGTSSAFAVGLLGALHQLRGDTYSKKQLADEAIEVERCLCAEAGGWQDQVAVAFGGMNRIDFSGGSYTVTPINISQRRKRELNDNMLLYFTGKFRTSTDIQQRVEKEIINKPDTLRQMKDIALRAQKVLENENENLDKIGEMLDESWKLKRSLSSAISGEYIDELYSAALSAGALGGKLLGAGEGGFLLLYTGADNKERVREKLKKLGNVPFRFTDDGFSVIHDVPDTDMKEE